MRCPPQDRRSAAASVLPAILLLPLLCGCPPPGPTPKEFPAIERELSEIVGVIERNSALLNQALWSQSISVTARFNDEKGKQHIYNLEGTFLFDVPRRLRMDLRPAVGDQVMQLGSNDEVYWVWIEPEFHLMKWGRHRHAGKPCSELIAVRPDRLASAIGFGGLPSREDGLIGPARKFGRQYDILYYLRPGDDGTYLIDREFWVERVPPFMVRVVQFRDSLGRTSVTAYLDDYRPAWDDGPLVPFAVSVSWPQDDGRFTMRIARLRGVPADKVSENAFVMPSRENLPPAIQTIIQVDRDCDDLEALRPESAAVD
jgi:hypothetical protein